MKSLKVVTTVGALILGTNVYGSERTFEADLGDSVTVGADAELGLQYEDKARKADESETLGGKVRLNFDVTHESGIKFMGAIETGNGKDTKINDFYDVDADKSIDDADEINLNSAAVEMEFDAATITAGVIENSQVLGDKIGLDTDSTFTGGQAIFDTALGMVRARVGSINNLDERDILDREYEQNYMSIEISRELFENLYGEVSLEQLEEADGEKVLYFSGAAQYDVMKGNEELFSILGQTIVNNDTDGHKSSLGISKDIYGFSANASYNYMSDDAGQRAQLTDEFSQIESDSASFGLQTKFFQDRLSVSGDYIYGLDDDVKGAFDDNQALRLKFDLAL